MPDDPMVEFYGSVFEQAWNSNSVPTPQGLADWIESRRWSADPRFVESMVERLRGWPRGRNYPVVPDDDAMRERLRNGPAEELRWWEPGARRGDLVRSLPGAK